MGSTEAVSKIKWLFQAEKAGHAGTLDPLASGMLPIALGEATKTVPYVQDGAKIYRFTVAWGEERSTDDLEGPVTKSSDQRPAEADILALLPKYTGVIMQTPPQFSAIKIAGERAYDLARDGETVDIPAREVEIGRLDLIEHGADRHHFRGRMRQGHLCALAGARHGPRSRLLRPYLRTAPGRGRAVHAGRLRHHRRTGSRPLRRAGRRRSQSSGHADATDAPVDFGAIDALLVDTAAALDCLPQIAISDDAATKIRLGNPVIIRGRDAPWKPRKPAPRRAASWSPSAPSSRACSSPSGSLPGDSSRLIRDRAYVEGHMAKAETVKTAGAGENAATAGRGFAGTLIADPAARRSELRLTLISPEKFKTIDNASIDDLNTHCDHWPVSLAGLHRSRQHPTDRGDRPDFQAASAGAGRRRQHRPAAEGGFLRGSCLRRRQDDRRYQRRTATSRSPFSSARTSSLPSRSVKAIRSIPSASASRARCPTGCARAAPTISPMR